MEEHKVIPMAYKVEMVDGEIVERELTPEEYEIETKWADEIRNSFLPKAISTDG